MSIRKHTSIPTHTAYKASEVATDFWWWKTPVSNKARVECLQAFLFLLLMFYVSLSFCLSSFLPFFLNASVLLMYDRVLLDWLLFPNKLVSEVFVSFAKTGFRNLVLPNMLTKFACPMPETSTNKLDKLVLYAKKPKDIKPKQPTLLQPFIIATVKSHRARLGRLSRFQSSQTSDWWLLITDGFPLPYSKVL